MVQPRIGSSSPRGERRQVEVAQTRDGKIVRQTRIEHIRRRPKYGKRESELRSNKSSRNSDDNWNLMFRTIGAKVYRALVGGKLRGAISAPACLRIDRDLWTSSSNAAHGWADMIGQLGLLLKIDLECVS